MALRSRTVSTLPGVLASSSPAAKPILKRVGRPSSLPLSPSPFSANFSAMLSVSSARSPHVHFPPSPLLHSVISIQTPISSSSTSSIIARGLLSPNAVEVAGGGGADDAAQEAVSFSVSVSSPLSFTAFRLADPPKKNKAAKEKLAVAATAVVDVNFEDPRSPRPTSLMSLGAAALKLTNSKLQQQQQPTDLYKALTTFPRSPYPSAPAQEDEPGSTTGFPTSDLSTSPPPKRRNSESAVPTPPPRARSLGARNTNHHSLTSKSKPTTISSSLSRTRVAPPPLDLFSSFGGTTTRLSPVQEDDVVNSSSNKVVRASTSPASALSNAFWQSVSLDMEGLPLSGWSDGGFPESVSSGESLDNIVGRAITELPPVCTPQMMLFGDVNGNLWSPGLAKQQQQQQPRGGFLLDVVGAGGRSTLTAPSPKDPRAKFPSFSTAFGVVQMIRPPVRAHLA